MAFVFCSLLLALTLSLRTSAAQQSPQVQAVVDYLIADASISKLNSTIPNSDPSCHWPACAAVCGQCPKASSAETCKVQLFYKCPINSQCIIGSCFCNEGTCLNAQNACTPRVCVMGAVPPKLKETKLKNTYLMYAPSTPEQGATIEEWANWAKSCYKAPLAILMLGVTMSTVVFCCLAFHLECECRFLPRGPCLLVTLCVLAMFATGIGIGQRAISVNTSMRYGEAQLRLILKAADETRSLVDSVVASKQEFQNSLESLPTSCSSYVPMAKQAAGKAAIAARTHLTKLNRALDIMEKALTAVIRNLRIVLDKYVWKMEFVATVVPAIPLLTMTAGMLTMAIAALTSWFSKDPDVSEMADNIVLRCGSCFISCSIIMAALLAAGIFYSGIVLTGFCVNLDSNIVDIVSKVNFTKLANVSYPIDPIVRGTVEYYLTGRRENPLHTLLGSAESTLDAMLAVYDSSTWLVKPAAMACPGLDNLKPAPLVTEGHRCIELAKAKVSAAFVWPMYNTVFRHMVCRAETESMYDLAKLTMFIGFVAYPIIAIIADIDLRKWADHKEANHEDHFGVPRDDYGDDDDQGLLSKNYDYNYKMAARGYPGH